MAAEASEAEGGCIPGGAVVGGEVVSGGVRRHRYIGLGWGATQSYDFACPPEPRGRRILSLVEA